jgi:hypothetical protein
VLQGFRVIPEGGAEKIKGKRWINENVYNPLVNFDETKMIPFSIKGNQLVGVLVTNAVNATDLYIYRYPYEHGTETVVPIVAAGSTNYDTDQFDYAVVDNYLVLVHFTGQLKPQYLEFDSDTGAYLGTSTQNDNALIQAYGNFRNETLFVIARFPDNVEITSSDPAVAAELQASTHIYLEGFGYRESDDGRTYNFVTGNYHTKISDVTNGILTSPTYDFREGTASENAITFANISTVSTWALNLYGPGNWPKTVTVHEGRLVFGGCDSQPMSLAGSRVNNYTDFNRIRIPESGNERYVNGVKNAGALVPTDPYLFTINSGEDAEITAVNSSGELFIGTDRREYVATGSDTLLSALSVQIKPYTSQGVFPISTAVMSNLVCYLDQSRKKLFQFKFNDRNGTFLSDELSLLFADKIEGDRIKKVAWAPHVKVLYVLMDSEVLYGITYDPSSETQAFFETLETGVTSIAYVAAREEDAGESHHRGDHLLMLVRGKGLYSYEQIYFEKGVSESYIKEDMLKENEYFYWEDAYEIKRNGANDYSINGETFSTGSDNFPVPNTAPVFTTPFRAMNMDTGEVTTVTTISPDLPNLWWLIDDPVLNGASKILIGNIPTRENIVATMPIEAGQQFGPAQLGIKNMDELGIRFYKSYSYDISADGETWQEVRVADKEGNAVTGRKETKFQGKHAYDFRVWVKSDKAEPLVITGINMKGVSNDG